MFVCLSVCLFLYNSTNFDAFFFIRLQKPTRVIWAKKNENKEKGGLFWEKYTIGYLTNVFVNDILEDKLGTKWVYHSRWRFMNNQKYVCCARKYICELGCVFVGTCVHAKMYVGMLAVISLALKCYNWVRKCVYLQVYVRACVCTQVSKISSAFDYLHMLKLSSWVRL